MYLVRGATATTSTSLAIPITSSSSFLSCKQDCKTWCFWMHNHKAETSENCSTVICYSSMQIILWTVPSFAVCMVAVTVRSNITSHEISRPEALMHHNASQVRLGLKVLIVLLDCHLCFLCWEHCYVDLRSWHGEWQCIKEPELRLIKISTDKRAHVISQTETLTISDMLWKFHTCYQTIHRIVVQMPVPKSNSIIKRGLLNAVGIVE